MTTHTFLVRGSSGAWVAFLSVTPQREPKFGLIVAGLLRELALAGIVVEMKETTDEQKLTQ
jgi:hypothetical protein